MTVQQHQAQNGAENEQTEIGNSTEQTTPVVVPPVTQTGTMNGKQLDTINEDSEQVDEQDITKQEQDDESEVGENETKKKIHCKIMEGGHNKEAFWLMGMGAENRRECLQQHRIQQETMGWLTPEEESVYRQAQAKEGGGI